MIAEETDIIEQLLLAREKRQELKNTMVSSGCHLVSLQLNIPGIPKTDKLVKNFIQLVDEEFTFFFISHFPITKWVDKKEISDEAGDAILFLFKASDISSVELKAICENFEGSFPLGRIVDLDVLSADGLPVSSGKAKKCFLCSDTAEICRKSNAHQPEEVRMAMFNSIEQFITAHNNAKLTDKVSQIAINALLHEVALSPKPGLVCRHSSGAHSDMDFTTFINSTSAIAPFFREIGKLAICFEGRDVAKALPLIRQVGLKMEQAMLHATGGVNTHKGAIFLQAITCFAIIRSIKKYGYLKVNALSSVVMQLSRGMIQRELCAVNENDLLSHGQKCFLQYGLQGAGARGEAEQGLPVVVHHALPLLKELVKKDLSNYTDLALKQLLIPVLLKIMSINNDTNVLYRHDKAVLESLKQKSSMALNNWLQQHEEPYYELVQWCNEKRVSPGGAADLLAVTLTIYNCQTEFAKGK